MSNVHGGWVYELFVSSVSREKTDRRVLMVGILQFQWLIRVKSLDRQGVEWACLYLVESRVSG